MVGFDVVNQRAVSSRERGGKTKNGGGAARKDCRKGHRR